MAKKKKLTESERMRLIQASLASLAASEDDANTDNKDAGSGWRARRMWSTEDGRYRVMMTVTMWKKFGNKAAYSVGLVHPEYMSGKPFTVANCQTHDEAVAEYERWIQMLQYGTIPDVLPMVDQSPLALVMLDIFGAEALSIKRGAPGITPDDLMEEVFDKDEDNE